ncbi:MAG: hypothetical protein K2X52_19170 [Mycobacteriaceae bacterium]|nr:hypothetical protein [Mycobacteriaceae bacterium]
MAQVRRNGRTRRKKAGAHRKVPTRRTALASSVAAGGAALSIGAASYLGVPTAEALSILLPGPEVDGAGSATRINILEGNVFNPQFGLDGNNSSTNLVIGSVALNRYYSFIDQLLSLQINLSGTTGRVVSTQVNILSDNVLNPQLSLSGANMSNNVRVANVAVDNGNNTVSDVTGTGSQSGTGNGNTVQYSFLSGNIFNPQISLIGANISNNVTVTNVAMNNGNNSVATTSGGLLPLLGGGAGNGNSAQFSLFSGNILNPQTSLTGANISNNVSVTNVAIGNGNGSQAISTVGNALGSFVFGGGNGNSYQYGSFVSNISNPQWTLGGGNTSNNSATTNTADGNGNGSSNAVAGGGLGSVVTGTGNGNTNQAASGSGNIHNDQVNIGRGTGGPGSSSTTAPKDFEDVISLVSASTDARTSNSSPASASRPFRINRQSQQERRELFSFSRSGTRATSAAVDNASHDADGGSQSTGVTDGVTAGGGSTDDGGASDNGGDGNGDSGA